jgi:hypothetical protein
MTIHPPKVVVTKEEPFKHALFGREEFGKSLLNILRSVSDDLVIFVNAPWGAGKTTFAQMWLAYLRENQKLEVIYYDAYAADYFDDPFVSFSGEIVSLTKRLEGDKALVEREEFKKSAIEVGKRLAGLATKVGLRAATLGALDSTQLKELKEISSEIAAGVSEIGSDIIENKIENYAAEKDALSVFKKRLTKLAAKIRKEYGFPLTIVVDELDRCRPDFALGLLERMKHLFDVEGLAFVLLVNREQIENYIRAVYGNRVDARSYLLKFGNLFVDLPSKQSVFSYQYEPGRKEYCHSLIDHYGLSKRVPQHRLLGNCAAVFADHFELTLREIEKAFAVMAIYYGSVPQSQEDILLFVALLSVLKVKHPALYQGLSRGRISADQFFAQTALDQLRTPVGESPNEEWIMTYVKHFLMSDKELSSAIALEGQPAPLARLKHHFHGDRKKIIPSLCWCLDRFSLLPQ